MPTGISVDAAMAMLDPRTTALVLVDLQQGVVGMQDLAPRSGDEVLAVARDLAARFREQGAPVFLVHVAWRDDDADRPSRRIDRPSLAGGRGPLPPGFSDFAEGLCEAGDAVILKRHWGAFTGTDLDLQLRRRGIGTLVIAGIATNFGVESTVRSAWEHSYDVIVVEDACTSRSLELHRFAIDAIFPQIARVMAAGDIAFEAR